MLSYIFDNFLCGGPRLIGTLHGHSGPVVSVAISPNGRLLASGGVDGVKVWELKTRQEIIVPQQPFHERGQVSCVCWMTRDNETFDTLCYGNALGYLVFLQHRPAEGRFELAYSVRIARGGEILSLAADRSGGSSTRLATGTRDKCVQVWVFDSSSRKLLPVHSKAFAHEKDIVPKALAFDSNKNQDLYVFGLYDGGLHKYGGIDGKWTGTYQLGSKIGNADVDLEHRLCVVDNVGNGFDVYKLDSGHFVRTFFTREPIKTYPKGVVFANNCRAVIAGSDHGRVYIFDRKTGRNIKTLKHGKEGGVQIIGVYDGDEATIIASASASSSGPSPILLWRWIPKNGERKDTSNNVSWSPMKGVELVIKIVIIVAATAYFVGLVREEVGNKFKWLLPAKSGDEGGHGKLGNETIGDYIRRELMKEMVKEMVKTGYKMINSSEP